MMPPGFIVEDEPDDDDDEDIRDPVGEPDQESCEDEED